MKTLSFQKETLRSLVSMELDAVIGGGANNHVSSAFQPTSTAVSSAIKPISVSSLMPPGGSVSSVQPPGGSVSSVRQTNITSVPQPTLTAC